MTYRNARFCTVGDTLTRAEQDFEARCAKRADLTEISNSCSELYDRLTEYGEGWTQIWARQIRDLKEEADAQWGTL